MPAKKLFVAHYGHPMLRGAKHWAILREIDDDRSVAYQITGSTTTYAIKAPEVIIAMRSMTYLGKVVVGLVEESQFALVEEVLQGVPVTQGDLQWNCQNWVVQALGELKAQGVNVEAPTQVDLTTKLQGASR